MNHILEKIFKKRGIESVDKLSREERETFQMYEHILAKKEMTLADMREFIGARIQQIESKWQDTNVEQSKKAELIPYHAVYKMLFQAIDAPQLERQALEKALLAQLEL